MAACMNCCEVFVRTSDGKRYDRYSVNKAVPDCDITVGQALFKFLDFRDPVTPVCSGKKSASEFAALEDRCLCSQCYKLLVKIVRGQRQVEEAALQFKSATGSGYVQRKTSAGVQRLPTTPVRTLALPGPELNEEKSKRKLSEISPDKTPRTVKQQPVCRETKTQDTPASSAGRVPFKATVVSHVNNCNYGTAVRILMMKSSRARGQIFQVLAKMVQHEVRNYSQKASLPTKDVSLETLEQFSWSVVLQEVIDGLPLTWLMLQNMISPMSKSKRHHLDIQEDSFGSQIPALGFIFFTAMFRRFPQKFKFFAIMNSVMLYKHGNHHAVSTVSSGHAMFTEYNTKL